MTAHLRQPDRHGERLFAAGHHAAANPVAGWVFDHTGALAFGAVFLLTMSVPQPALAAVVALGIAALLTIAGVAVSLRGAAGNCNRIIAEVQARESGEDGQS